MIRILYIIDSMECGGTQTHIANMLRGHDRSLFSPYLLCLQEKGSLGEELESQGFPVISYGLRKIYALKAALSYPRYIRFLRRERIEVVHAYLFAAHAYGIPGARIAGVPLVIAGRRAVGVYWMAAKYRAVRRLSNLLAHVQIGNSEAVREFVVRNERVPRDRVRVVYNGIDASRFRPSPEHRPAPEDGRLVIGYVGSLTRVKGVDLLLRAACAAIGECPGLRVLLVGSGPGETRRWYEGPTDLRLRELAGELGIAGRVTFAGASMRVPEDLRRMDIFIMPSVSEGMSNAVIEAMGTELPVIASDGGGNREVVADGSTGLLFPPGDERRLAECIVALARDPDRRRKMGRAGRKRVIERFTVERMVSEMERVYMEELSRRMSWGR